MPDLDYTLDELATYLQAALEDVKTLRKLLGAPVPEPAPAPKPVTKEELRSILAAAGAAGYSTRVRGLLAECGASRLSDVNPDAYAHLFAAAQKLMAEVNTHD